MADRYTLLEALPEINTLPTREQAVQRAKEYMLEHPVARVYVAKVVATVERQSTHKTTMHSR